MKNNLLFTFCIIFPFWMGCSSGGQHHANACEQHPEIQSYIEKFISELIDQDIQGEKMVTSDEKVETVKMNREELAEAYTILLDLDIDLPNLIGRYGCEFNTSGEQTIENYFALDDNLTVRYVKMTFVDDELMLLEGRRKVGSILASIDQNLEWNLKTGNLNISVEYKNLFGREYTYEIMFYGE